MVDIVIIDIVEPAVASCGAEATASGDEAEPLDLEAEALLHVVVLHNALVLTCASRNGLERSLAFDVVNTSKSSSAFLGEDALPIAVP